MLLILGARSLPQISILQFLLTVSHQSTESLAFLYAHSQSIQPEVVHDIADF